MVSIISSTSAHTAQVICKQYDSEDVIADGWMYYQPSELYVGDIVIPAAFTYNTETYNVFAIWASAFANSQLMTSLSIPASITSIGSGAFTACNGLTSINVDENNTQFFSSEGVMYTRSPLSIYLVPRAISGNINLHKDISEIPSSAFQYCSKLDAITLPDNVFTVKDGAFDHCSALAEVNFGKRVKTLERNAFSNCPYLQIITLPNSLRTIGNNAFDGCSDLALVTLGDSVETIGKYAFSGCDLRQITLPQTLTSIDDYAFQGCSNLKTIYNYSNLNIEKGATSNGYVGYYAEEIITEQTPTELTQIDEQAQIIVNGNQLEISDVNSKSITIYDCKGNMVYATQNACDYMSINLPAGIYCIKVGTNVHKVCIP